MNKKLKKTTSLILVMSIFTMISFYNLDEKVIAKESKVIKISVDEDYQLPSNKNKEVKYKSSSKKVVTVSKTGIIRGKKVGKASITAQIGKKKLVYNIKVAKSKFYVKTIDDKLFKKMKNKSFKKNCTLSRDELRYIHVLHKNINGKTLVGEMVVNKHIAKVVLNIFKKLYQANYPIERMKLVDEYNADDEKSMRDNNSSSFNFRFISHTTKISKHGYGLAVDINTLYNPYVKTVDGKTSIEPATAKKYVNRSKKFDYKIEKGDLAYKLFVKAGFEWGGNWTDRKDYQHFEIPTDKINAWYPENA